MALNQFLNQLKLSRDIVTRLGDVLEVANEFGDHGVVEWVHVAMSYAVNGKLRDRDMNKLTQLERVYANDFYRLNRTRVRNGDLAFA